MGDFYEETRAPRLILALNSTTVAPMSDSIGTDKSAVEQVLKYVWQRLSDSKRLEDCWRGQDGWRGTLPDASSGLTQDQQVEEQWATTITEMLMGVLYSSPGQSYKDDNGQDHFFFERMAPDSFPSEGVPYPLTAACQQLCTMALISRGYTRKDFGDGLNAGGSKQRPLYTSGGGQWIEDNGWLQPNGALSKPIPDGVGPGAVYEWTPATGANTDGSHIAFVLRTHRPGPNQGSWNGIQFFDTGGVSLPSRATGVTVRTDGQGNYDDPWIAEAQSIAGPAAFTGIGILPGASKAPDLQTAINHMRLAWPLGFARIVVTIRGQTQPLYASPLLLMNTVNPAASFSIARYLWSLRELPGRKDLNVVWQIIIPSGKLADCMLNGSRGQPLSVMLDSIQEISQRDKPLKTGLYKSLVELCVDPSGQVHLLSQLNKVSEKMPFGLESGSLAPPGPNSIQDYPDYYKPANV